MCRSRWANFRRKRVPGSGGNELAADDTEVADYVRSLEEARDTTELPEASGEAIAQEFERYLKRRDDGPSRP